MNFRPGLNVLVGPNGAGKTNIVEALELLSLLSDKPVSEAVGELGGTGAIVSKTSNDTYSTEIRFEVTGDRLITREKYLEYSHAHLAARTSLRGIKWARYRYSLSIYVDKEQVRVSTESFALWLSKVRRVKGEIRPVHDEHARPDYLVDRAIGNPKSRPAAISSSVAVSGFSEHYYERRFDQQLNDRTFGEGDLAGEKTLIWHARQLHKNFLLNKVVDDLFLGAPFNIVPSRVRQPMDISEEAVLSRDGYGFASALWALQKNDERKQRRGKPSVERLVAYSTTIDGPDLLRKARPSYIQRSSRSFDRLKRQIAFSCWWLAQ